jgi:hypothetical protein
MVMCPILIAVPHFMNWRHHCGVTSSAKALRKAVYKLTPIAAHFPAEGPRSTHIWAGLVVSQDRCRSGVPACRHDGHGWAGISFDKLYFSGVPFG